MNPRNLLSVMTSKGKKYLVIGLLAFFIVLGFNAVLTALFPVNPLEGRNIIIDPGHGGIDPGTNDGDSFFEKDINLQISHILSTDLQGYKCFSSMTRTVDNSLDGSVSSKFSRHQKDLMARVEKFNNGAYDLFISIHVNRSSNKGARGPMIVYSPASFSSRFLAECLQDRLNSHARKYFGKNFERKPVKSSFYILKNSNIPGVIVETGFISNSEDKNLLKEPSYQAKLSNAICLGIMDYYKNIEEAKAKNKNGEENLEEEIPFNITNEVRLVMD